MERVDLMPPPDGDDSAHGDCAHGDSAHGVSAQDDPVTGGLADRADAYAAVPLLNCLLREVARPVSETVEHRVHHLPGVDRLLRVRGTRRPAQPEVRTAGGWHRIGHTELVKLVAEELRRHTGLSNHELPAEMIDSRDAVAALLAARARATPPDDPYRRSEQSLLTGHTHHPAPRHAAAAPPPDGCPTRPRRTPASR
ncbi:hypothetical protein STAFG_1921 [Streptomyces afghaniensis 772]|uniref:Uncharacterized protein n=1 Tax=Streptomyces afghaniensis 772 TaxID=1283301 RepID=S4MN83_9ACTN|nr:hypothetical protein STAFG_1921 [Streptomyces afghaniensis 772]